VPVSDNVTNRLVRLEGAVGRVFKKAMDWAEEDFRREIEEIKWTWPRETKRRNNTPPVGSPRDIVDLGGLRDSQKREDVEENITIFTWTGGEGKSYALEVHDGYTSKGGNRMPARPFTDNTISRLREVVAGLLSEEINNV
jgi:hypothetical protein